MSKLQQIDAIRDPEFRPASYEALPPGTFIELQEHRPEISRRDHFIGQALAAVLVRELVVDPTEPECRDLARDQVLRAIAYADMVIELTAEGEAHD
jgi:hypothetical protein